MSGERIDYGIERQRHEGFVGRTALLAWLDQMLVVDRIDRWMVVTGGPGVGKSATLSAWLARREAAGAVVPHHFIRRGEYDWDDPTKLVSSLVAQIAARFPAQSEPAADAQRHPAARLVATLARVSANELVPRGERLVILIDGLDEYDPPQGAMLGDPLAGFLPHALPRGVSFLCASRPRHPYVAMLEARDGELVQIDLDDPDFAADNDATVRGFWELAAPSLGLGARFIDEAVARAGGNLQHAVTLRKHLAGLPSAERHVESIPRGLAALLVKLWRRIGTDPLAVLGLGILCAAREALTLDELGAVAGWTGLAQRQEFMRSARELLVETQRADSQPEYRLHHDTIRAHIASMVGVAELRGHHVALAQQLATWPPPADPTSRRYALRHALTHRAEAGDWANAWRLAADMVFLEAKVRELGAEEAEADVTRTAERCRASGEQATSRRLDDLARALVRESHQLRAVPEATAALVWNRLRRSGWTMGDLDEQLRIPAGTAFLRTRHATTRESAALVRDLVGHTDAVTACAVTPDGRRVVSASLDGTLKIWELRNGRLLTTCESHAERVTACAVTCDSECVVSASYDGTLKVWEIETGRVLTTFRGHARKVLCCAVSPDGRHVVSASVGRTLKVWDLNTGRLLANLEGHTAGVNGCTVTADGKHAVSASSDRTLKVWDLNTGRVVTTLVDHSDGVLACALTPDGERVVSASSDRTLKVWDIETGRVLTTLQGHAGRVRACAVTRDGGRVISASDDRTLKVWDIETGRAVASFEGHSDVATACAVAPDGRWVISASEDHTLKVWDLDRGRLLTSSEGHNDWVSACAVTPDERCAVSTSWDQTLKIWDVHGACVLATLEGHNDWITACAVTPDSRRVISASQDRTLKVWGIETGDLRAILDGHTDWVSGCAVTPDGRGMVSASWDRTLKLWDLDSGRVLATLRGHGGRVKACAVTPDGRRLVSASQDHTLRVWDLEARLTLAILEGHTRGVTACAVTPDGRRVVSASLDHTLKVWDIEGGRILATLEGHAAWVNACAVTPDGRRAVSASHDRTLKVWDLETYACLFTHWGDAVYTAVAAPMTGVIAGDYAGTLWFLDWPLSATRPIASPVLGARVAMPELTAPRKPRPSQRRHVIVFLAANPTGTSRLALDEECAAIERELRLTSGRDDFDFRSKWAVSVDEMMRHLNELQPTIIHFSGHAGRGTGICLEDAQRQPQHVTARALAQVIGSAAPSARVVVLNACFSDAQAEPLRGVVDCVVGMRGAIDDDSARSFAVGFYRALGYRRSLGNAVAQAVATLAAKQLSDDQLPICRTRDGVDADHVILPDLALRTA